MFKVRKLELSGRHVCEWECGGGVMDGNQEECGTKTCRILADVVFFFLGGGETRG